METKKTAIVMAMAVLSLTGCGSREVPKTSEPQTLPVTVETNKVQYYTETESATPLAPVTKLKLKGTDYSLATLNTEVFDFSERTVDEFLNTASVFVDGSQVKNIENSDFRFHGFALVGGEVKMYAEFTKNGELVQEFDENDIGSYELKAIYTSSELLKDNGSYLIFGARTFVGLSRKDVEMTFGKGYTSGYDKSTFYYPDENGFTLALTYEGESEEKETLTELYLFKE